MSFRTACCKKSSLIFALLALAVLTAPAFGQTCLQNEYNQVQKQKLNCTANDVRIAEVTNIRNPLTGATLDSCTGGVPFNFLADFKIVTTSSQARENIGLYIATNSTTQALTGSCVDHIISAQHPCASNTSLNCGSNNYHETDSAPDNCGDTSSSDGGGTGVEIVTLEIDGFACTPPTGSDHLVLPNCTSWQIPGGTIQCVSGAPDTYPFNGPGGTPTAIPGSPSKCNCGVIPLAITVQKPSVTVGKTCNTVDNVQTPDFTTNPPTPNSCTIHPEGGQVTYTVDVNNNLSNFGDVIVDQICDSAYGQIYPASPAGTCAPGTKGASTGTTCTAALFSTAIPFNADRKCSFTADQPEDTTVTNTVQVSGHGVSAGSFGPTSSNSVQVVSNESPTTGTITKGFGGNTAGCATVRYNVTVANTSAAGSDETLSLTAFNDDAFGSITTVHDSVLGTTCGVTAGAGTLSGTAGAGTLPATVSVGSSYTCQFDGNFCSGLDVNGCFSHKNTVSGNLTGDENQTVTLTPGSVNVKECLAGSVVP